MTTRCLFIAYIPETHKYMHIRPTSHLPSFANSLYQLLRVKQPNPAPTLAKLDNINLTKSSHILTSQI